MICDAVVRNRLRELLLPNLPATDCRLTAGLAEINELALSRRQRATPLSPGGRLYLSAAAGA